MAKEELKPIDTSKYKITDTGQVVKMTEEDLRKQATSTVEWENTPVLDRPLFVHAYITGAKSRENRIEELEKENAELKEHCLILADCDTCYSPFKNENIEMKEQLTKAKEIIKDYMTIVKGAHTTVCGVSEENRTINALKLNEEAEHFLREVEN